MKTRIGLSAAAFTFALLAGISYADWVGTGDSAYWVDQSGGVIYCAVINSATSTNSPADNVLHITDAKAKKDVFCANPVSSPSNLHFAASILATESGVLCNSVGWIGNVYGDYVARASAYFPTDAPGIPAGCGGGQRFTTYGGSSVLAMGSSRLGSNQTGPAWQN